MPGQTGANLGLTWGWADGEAGWGQPTNASLSLLDTLVMLGVKDSTLSAPPASPAEGDRYIIPATPAASGAWATHEKSVAAFVGGAWAFYVPKLGWTARSASEGRLEYDGTNWTKLQAGIADAPHDGVGYARKDGDWTPVSTGGGIPEAPNDGKQYARKSQGWFEVALPALAVENLSNVVITNVQDKDRLAWDATSGKWVNKPNNLTALSDTNISSPTDKQVLAWDAASNKWTNQTVSGGGGGIPDAPTDGQQYTRGGSGSATWNALGVFVASGPSHAPGLVPDPGSTAGTTKYLREDGTWQVPAGGGGIPEAPTDGQRYTRGGSGTASWQVLGAFVASGASHAAGLVPDPGSTAGTTKYLREDGSWVVPPYPSTMVASGGSHAGGLVPDPGATAGTTRYLREDGTWQAPPSGSSGATALSGLSDVSAPVVPVIGPPNTDTLSTSGYVWKGNVLNATVSGTVATLTVRLQTQAGTAYRAAIATASGGTGASGTITSTPTLSNSITAGSSGWQDVTFTFSPGFAVTAGTNYAFLVGTPAGNSTYPTPVDGPVGRTLPANSYFTMVTISRLTANPVTNGSTYDTGSGTASPVTIRVALQGSPAGQVLRSTGGIWSNSAIQPGDLPVMVASGASHAPGAVPDPGATAGTTRYLREDGTWAAPPGTIAEAPSDGVKYMRRNGAWSSFFTKVNPYGTHAYWRINCSAAVTAGLGMRVAELRFFDLNGNQIATTGGTPSASAQLGTFGPDLAFDGNTGTYYRSNQAPAVGAEIFLAYQFTAVQAISKIQIAVTDNLGGAPSNFTVQYSDDGSTWTTAWTVTGAGPYTDQTFVEFVSPDVTNTSDDQLRWLGDVKLSSLTNGQAIVWSTAQAKFVNSTITMALSGLTDVVAPAAGGVVGNANGDSVSGSGFCWKGNILTAKANCSVASFTARLNATSGVTYQAALATASGGTGASGTITSGLTLASTFTASSTGWQDVTFTFATPFALTSGTTYAFLIGGPTGALGTYALPLDNPSGGTFPANSFLSMVTVARVSVNPPVNGTSYDTNSGFTAPMTIRVTIQGAPAGQVLRSDGLVWRNSAIQVGDLPVLKASGASHAAGVVPDPGATAGITKFLREDASWMVPPLSGRNGFVDGNFDSWQTGTSFTLSSSAAYTADMWVASCGDGAGTVSQLVIGAEAPPAWITTPRRCKLRFQQTTASTTNQPYIQQRTEGVSRFSGRSVTVSVSLAAAASAVLVTAIQATQNFGTGGSPSSNVTTSTPVSWTVGTTEQRFSVRVDIPSIAGKTIGTNGDDRLAIMVVLTNGATFTLDFSQIQIEECTTAASSNTTGAGGAPTSFEYLGQTLELEKVNRYLRVLSVAANQAVCTATAVANNAAYAWMEMFPPMRMTPAVNLGAGLAAYGILGGGATTSYTGAALSPTRVQFGAASSTNSYTPGQTGFLAGTGSASQITLDARI